MIDVFKTILLKLSFLLLLVATGCQQYNGPLERQTHIIDHQQQLAEKTNKVLSEKDSFGLNDCIEIALQNNLNVKSSEIQKKIAKLERKVSFSNFLPTVNLDYQYTRWNKDYSLCCGSYCLCGNSRIHRTKYSFAYTFLYNPDKT